MKAAVVETAGADPTFAEFTDPPVEAGRTVVELVAAGVHPVVRSLIGGRHYGSAGRYPAIPGVDCVARTADGELVYTGYAEAPYGTFAERISVPAEVGFPLPDGADPAVVAGTLNPGLASWLPLQAIAGEAAGQAVDASVLVVGATGSAGRLAVQNARALGAGRVVALARDAGRLDEVGADGTGVVGCGHDADVAAILEALDGHAPRLVLDFTWGPVAAAVFEALGSPGLYRRGDRTRHVHIGSAAGLTAAVPGALLRSRPYELVGSGMGSTPMETLMVEIPRYLQLIADGTVAGRIRTFPLSDVAAAWQPETPGLRHVVVA